jgi:hypothetical protein
MPEISRFYGIVIRLYYADHEPPHVHARYQRSEVQIQIEGLETEGTIPSRALRLVEEWIGLHRAELLVAWERAQRGEEPGRIEPLP